MFQCAAAPSGSEARLHLATDFAGARKFATPSPMSLWRRNELPAERFLPLLARAIP